MISKFGGNGKVELDTTRKTATKRLRNPKDTNSKKRFIYEMNLLKSINNEIPNVVKIINIDEENLIITMKLYEGDISQIYDLTKGNTKVILELIKPLMHALKKLSELDEPIYHRDIKPQNILVEVTGENVALVLADFGCGYIKSDEDFRITDDFRAVGAQQYRAPEYQYGRVVDVDQRGDIFSIGKLIWNLFVGNIYEVFPYTLWFPKEYNLCDRYGYDENIIFLNTLIAACVNHERDKRISYEDLILLIENYLSNEKKVTSDIEKLRVQEFESKRVLMESEIRKQRESLLKLVYSDFTSELNDMYKAYNMELFERMIRSLEKVYKPNMHKIIDKIMENNSENTLYASIYDDTSFGISYRPNAKVHGLEDADTHLPYIFINFRTNSKSKYYIICFKKNILVQKYENDSSMEFYNKDIWRSILVSFMMMYMDENK